jgi:predicted nucleic acid-binding protein
MRIVVDTNVFVSAAFKETSWPGVVVKWVDHRRRLPFRIVHERRWM